MRVEFQLFRQLPPAPPQIQSFWVETTPGSTILDCLTQIKWEQDGGLAFRKNCRNAICGSCAMRVNGRAALACQQHINEALQPGDRIMVAPLGNMPVIRDLVVDMGSFWDNLEQVQPYVQGVKREGRIPQHESLQYPSERDQINPASGCILCGACYSDCNAREVNPDFVGPHALAKANRLLLDSRDRSLEQRLDQHNSLAGVWGCTRCLNCNVVCPVGVAPLDQITQIKQKILARSQSPVIQASRAIRHRKTLVELVRSGGWVDERKFGLQVVANQGLDPKGLLSLIPLGSQMLRRGKFPFRFKASEGTSVTRKLIDAARAQSRQS